MSFGWLSEMVGGRRVARPGVRRRMAPQARRDLTAEIDADALEVLDVWSREIVREPDYGGRPEHAVIAWVDADARLDVAAWLDGAGDDDARSPRSGRTGSSFPAAPEAILIGVVEGRPGETAFRFNVRFAADPYRHQLEALAEHPAARADDGAVRGRA